MRQGLGEAEGRGGVGGGSEVAGVHTQRIGVGFR